MAGWYTTSTTGSLTLVFRSLVRRSVQLINKPGQLQMRRLSTGRECKQSACVMHMSSLASHLREFVHAPKGLGHVNRLFSMLSARAAIITRGPRKHAPGLVSEKFGVVRRTRAHAFEVLSRLGDEGLYLRARIFAARPTQI
jgi:hypothetical protein